MGVTFDCHIERDLHGVTRNSPGTVIEYKLFPNAWRIRLVNGVIVWVGDEHLTRKQEPES